MTHFGYRLDIDALTPTNKAEDGAFAVVNLTTGDGARNYKAHIIIRELTALGWPIAYGHTFGVGKPSDQLHNFSRFQGVLPPVDFPPVMFGTEEEIPTSKFDETRRAFESGLGCPGRLPAKSLADSPFELSDAAWDMWTGADR